MNKTQLQDALREQGIPFDETETKAQLEAKLPPSEGNSSSGAEPDATPAGGGATAPASTGAEDPVFAEARAEVAAMTPLPTPKGILEEQIAAKMAAGLSRSQAIEVLERQADWDKHPNRL